MSVTKDIAVEVVDLAKTYGPVRALKSVNLKIGAGEYFVLLGPSGSGKTTLLRLIGGFIRPSSGRVLLHGHDVSDLPPNRRPTSMVFQSYALFPHMSVAENVGYGLRIRKMPKAEIRERAEGMLDLVGLGGYGGRMPHELSGGQQQRVQLARSLVLDADILLLDEPLASLDANLRKDMCLELKHLQEKVGITFIHVTHNQEEAMTVADDIAIVAAGNLVEAGKAIDVYTNPVRRFTADFMGENNIFDGRVTLADGGRIKLDLGYAPITTGSREMTAAKGEEVSVSVRSELLQLLGPDDTVDASLQTVPGRYRESVYLGLTISHLVELPDGKEVVVRRISQGRDDAGFEPGAEVRVAWKTEDGRLHVS